MFHSRKTGAFLTLVYMTASYRLVDVYVRSAVGEYCAFLFFPLIALGVWRIYTTKNKSIRENIQNGLILAVGMSGVITAHVLSSEMIAVALAVIFILTIRKSIQWNSLRTWLIGVAGTLLLSAFFIVPFLDYYKNVPVEVTSDIADNTAFRIQGSGLAWGEYFAFFNNPFGESSQLLCTGGIVLMGALILALMAWVKRLASAQVKVLSIASLCMLLMASNLFPWDGLSYHFKLFVMLSQVQFPWRYVALAIIVQTVLLGCVVSEHLPERLWKSMTACGKEKPLHESAVRPSFVIAVCSVISIFMMFSFLSFYADNANRTIYYDTMNLDIHNIMGAEYIRTVKDGDHYNLIHTEDYTGRFAASGDAAIEVLDRRGTDFDITCTVGSEPVTVTAPETNYKGFVVYDDQGNYYKINDDDDAIITFDLPAGFSGNIHIRFRDLWHWDAAMAVSALTAVGTCVFFVRNRHYYQQGR